MREGWKNIKVRTEERKGKSEERREGERDESRRGEREKRG